jgi:hypothetical protein
MALSVRTLHARVKLSSNRMTTPTLGRPAMRGESASCDCTDPSLAARIVPIQTVASRSGMDRDDSTNRAESVSDQIH